MCYTIIVPRESGSQGFEKKFEKIEKPLDNRPNLCYNVDTVREGSQERG
ncbi:MAG: hypothetical protein IJ309_07215 [Clostridia bacterium]|nr:hypothetical protein [Clostridia bacterium]